MRIEQLQYNLLFRWFVGMEMSHTVSHGRPEFSGVGVVLSVLSRFLASGQARIVCAAGGHFYQLQTTC
jgi:transposase